MPRLPAAERKRVVRGDPVRPPVARVVDVDAQQRAEVRVRVLAVDPDAQALETAERENGDLVHLPAFFSSSFDTISNRMMTIFVATSELKKEIVVACSFSIRSRSSPSCDATLGT